MAKEIKLVIKKDNIEVYEDGNFRGYFSPKAVVRNIRKILNIETFEDAFNLF